MTPGRSPRRAPEREQGFPLLRTRKPTKMPRRGFQKRGLDVSAAETTAGGLPKSIWRKSAYGPVAQGIEQQPSKLKVAGSNPAGVANKINSLSLVYARKPSRNRRHGSQVALNGEWHAGRRPRRGPSRRPALDRLSFSPTIGDIARIPLEGSSCVNAPAYCKRLGPFKYEAGAPTRCSIGAAGQALKCRRRR